jgi:hypothetical protein
MPDISDVDDMRQGKAFERQRPAQRVGKHIGAHIADMLEIIDGRPTGINARLASMDGGEVFQRAGQAVEEAERRGIGHGRATRAEGAGASMPVARLDLFATQRQHAQMASGKTLNAKNLAALGADRLTELLLELATGDAQAKRRLRLELVSQSGGGEVAAEVRKRLATIGKARSFVEWNKVREFGHDLQIQLNAITTMVAPEQPGEGFELLWRFLALAPSIYERCDDSNGVIGRVFANALDALVSLAPRANMPSAALVDRIFDAVCADSYGQFDEIIAKMAAALGPDGLRLLQARFEAMAKTPPSPSPDDVRRVIGYGTNGTIYEEDILRRRHESTVRLALTEIADALGDVDGYTACHSEAEQENPMIAARIARRLLGAGRADEAMRAVEKAEPAVRRNDHWPDWHAARVDSLDALGRTKEAQDMRWALFEKDLDARWLRAFVKKLPDFDDIEAEERGIAFACGHDSLYRALHFLIGWPALDVAGKMILARHAELDGNQYELMSKTADALDQSHPLAATLALRAMIDFALDGGRYKRYPHAARHLRSCETLGNRISDFGVHPDHQAYVAKLKAAHSRKHGFWGA